MIRRSFLLVALLVCASAAQAADRVLTVFAAASLTDVLEGIGRDFTAESGIPVRFSFAASSALARQIESGAPADVFVSADQEWMDYLQSRKLIAAGSRRNVVSNKLVLIAPADSSTILRIAPGFGLAAALGANGRLAVADPSSVPAGRYAKAALTALNVWSSVEQRLVPAENVRAALNFVARGEAPLGIVYATDARSDPKVKVVDVFPAATHEPITYPAATVSTATAGATDFVKFLEGPKARATFDKAGFGKP